MLLFTVRKNIYAVFILKIYYLVTEFTDSTGCVLSSYTIQPDPAHLSGPPGPGNLYRHPPSDVCTVEALPAEISD